MLNPINHARTPERASSATRSSPTSSPPTSTPRRHVGRGWTWYTGSAGWMYRVGSRRSSASSCAVTGWSWTPSYRGTGRSHPAVPHRRGRRHRLRGHHPQPGVGQPRRRGAGRGGRPAPARRRGAHRRRRWHPPRGRHPRGGCALPDTRPRAGPRRPPPGPVPGGGGAPSLLGKPRRPHPTGPRPTAGGRPRRTAARRARASTRRRLRPTPSKGDRRPGRADPAARACRPNPPTPRPGAR